MPRANKKDTELRARLETIAVQLAVIRSAMPVTRLRLEQARQRTGLTGLLSPALDELDSMRQAVDAIGEQVVSTLAKLVEW